MLQSWQGCLLVTDNGGLTRPRLDFNVVYLFKAKPQDLTESCTTLYSYCAEQATAASNVNRQQMQRLLQANAVVSALKKENASSQTCVLNIHYTEQTLNSPTPGNK